MGKATKKDDKAVLRVGNATPEYVDLGDFGHDEEDIGKVKCINVRTGRHVDFIQFVFENGRTREYGNGKNGEPCFPLEIDIKAREYIVRIKGRQGKHLDGIQFVTNLGRESKWYGGGGGSPFQMRAPAGTMIVGFGTEESDFCPKILQLRVRPCIPAPRRIGILRLLFHKNVRRLIFGGKPSLFQNSLSGSPSVLRLILRQRMIMVRVFFRGKTSFLRLVLDGEQMKEPMSLFRQLSTPPFEGGATAIQMMSCRNKSDKSSKSIFQLMLSGSPSVARQFFGKSTSKLTPLVQLLFEKDIVNGYPSVSHLLSVRDKIDGVEQPSVLEAVLEGEQYLGMKGVSRVLSLGFEDIDAKALGASFDLPGSPSRTGTSLELDVELDEDEEKGNLKSKKKEKVPKAPAVPQTQYPLSLIRLVLIGQPSLLSLVLEGEREGKPSIIRRLLEPRKENGISIARMVLTNFEDHQGHRPALSTYIFGGENLGRPSLLRMLVAGEARSDQHSLLRLLFFKYKPTRPGLFRGPSSFRKRTKSESSAPGREESKKERRSLVDLLTAGNPSLADLFFQGELEGEDSLARLMLGTCVDFKDGYIRVGESLKAGNENGISLMQWMLLGEEEGGPGISFVRLLLFGEEDNGFSLLRLMLLNENTNEPSLLRILMTTLKAILIAAKTRPHQIRNGEWRDTVNKIASSVMSSQKEGMSMRSQLERLAESLNPNGEQFKLFMSVLSTIPKRGKEFQELWKTQWLRIAKEIENAGKRAKKGTVWNKMAPTWKRLAVHMGKQDWAQLATDLAVIASSMDSISRLTEKIKRVHAATPAWMIPTSLISSVGNSLGIKLPTFPDPSMPLSDSDDDASQNDEPAARRKSKSRTAAYPSL